MWKPVKIDCKTFFMKYEKHVNHKVYLSDVVHVWMEDLPSHNVATRCKEMNMFIEAEPEDLADHVYTLVDSDTESKEITINFDAKNCIVNIKSQLAGVPFHYMFKMLEVDAETVCREVTVPLMILALQQQSHLSQLCDLLKAKDAEIEQYKLEGALLKKRKVQTEPFCEDYFMNNTKRYLMPEDTKSVQLFAKLCLHLPSVPLGNQNSTESACLSEMNEATDAERKNEVQDDVSHPTMELPSTYLPVVEKIKIKPKLQNKKPKLRL